MYDFTVRKSELERMYKEKQFLDTANKCAEYIAEIDIEDFEMFDQINSFYKIMFNCYFALEDAAECEKVLNVWTPYTRNSDEHLYAVLWNRARLMVVTGRGHEATGLLDQCINRYSYLDNTKAVADLYFIKGMATKELKHYKEAIRLYEKCKEDTKAAIELTQQHIKQIRHLK